MWLWGQKGLQMMHSIAFISLRSPKPRQCFLLWSECICPDHLLVAVMLNCWWWIIQYPKVKMQVSTLRSPNPIWLSSDFSGPNSRKKEQTKKYPNLYEEMLSYNSDFQSGIIANVNCQSFSYIILGTKEKKKKNH